MTDTYVDILDKLAKLDEVTLIEVLDLTAEEIIERCHDLIESRMEFIEEHI